LERFDFELAIILAAVKPVNMKRILQNLSPLLLVAVISACHVSKTVQSVSEKKEPKPNDYWAKKYMHPIYGFNEKLLFKGLNEIKEAKKNPDKIGVDLNGTWAQEGPTNIGGRVDVITPVHRTSDTIFAGTPNGGIFRTKNGGQTWEPVFDDFSYLAIGAIAVDPSNTQTIYAGTGDRNFGGGSYNGNGLYKSTDLGENWTNLGLQQVGIITSCIVHATQPNVILVGALGNGFAKTTERGVYRSTDGGATWQHTLFVSDSSGVCEMIADPQNPDVIYAATFNRVNIFGGSITNGPDSKIFKSTDAGVTWTQLTTGLPSVPMSRVGISISETNSNKLYAVYVDQNYQIHDVFLSNDAGISWTPLNVTNPSSGLDPDVLGGFGWYFGRIHINPFDDNTIVLPGIEQYASTDGGQTWVRNVPEWFTYEVHADKHALHYIDSTTMVIGTDGGMYKTTDAGQNWSVFGELPITQFYRITAKTFADGVYAGGAQDNGTCAGNSQTTWSRDFGGDGFTPNYIDVNEGKVVFETQRGGIHWISNNEGYVDLSIENSLGAVPLNWDTPYFVKETGELVAGTNKLVVMFSPPFDQWSEMSADLTRIAMGATTSPSYHTITELNSNPFSGNDVLVGTSDGLVWKGNFTNGSMTNVTANLPEYYVSSVRYSKKVNGKLYVAMTGYYNNFSQALVFKSENGGQSWTSIASNLPAIGVNSLITYMVAGNEVLFLGTDGGVYYSENDGQTWNIVGTNFPISAVNDLDIDEVNNKLLAGTYGRSMWSYDLNWYIGLNEAKLAEVTIYPNPVTDKLWLDTPAAFVKIISTDGRIVWSQNNYVEKQEIEVHSLKAGVYIIRTDKGASRFVKN
jgi:photosystem II stability/assembly factor-like uncharacterized protein